MKTAVRFQSRGGNTKAVAEIIAKMAGDKTKIFPNDYYYNF